MGVESGGSDRRRVASVAIVAALFAAASVSAARGDSGEASDPNEPAASQTQPSAGGSKGSGQGGHGGTGHAGHGAHGGKHGHNADPNDDATVRHPFDDLERWIGVFDDPSRAEWQKPAELVAALKLEPGQNVADIGAGTGYFNAFFAKAVAPGGTMYAADIEPRMVEYMKERAVREKTPNVVSILAAPSDPRLPAGTLDLVFVCDTYHHFDDRLDYFARLKKAMRPGGRLVIVDFQKRELPVGPGLDHKLAREQIVGELDQAGWKLIEEPGILPYQYFLIFRSR
jgi:SAM-dependent methyltransferase